MAIVQVSLWCLLPRWMLACDPYVSINYAPVVRLTKASTVFEVAPGLCAVSVVPFRDVSPVPVNGQKRFSMSRPTIGEFRLAAGDDITMRFHPAYLQNSGMHRGHLYVRSKTMRQELRRRDNEAGV
jgi:hypothetical protein